MNEMHDFVYKHLESLLQNKDDLGLNDKELMQMYVQLRILETLETISNNLDDLYTEVCKLNPMYK